MSWKIIVSAFTAIFIAEIGDKTQIAAFAMSGGSSARWSVFIGASLALIAATGIAVVAGGAVGRYIPAIWLRRAAGVTFLALGLIFLLTAPESADDAADSASPAVEQPAASSTGPTSDRTSGQTSGQTSGHAADQAAGQPGEKDAGRGGPE